jgi:glutathione peroxidase-family protein
MRDFRLRRGDRKKELMREREREKERDIERKKKKLILISNVLVKCGYAQ